LEDVATEIIMNKIC